LVNSHGNILQNNKDTNDMTGVLYEA
jgi:hypothetical protein